ncbi:MULTISPECIES: hypothetical protein [Paenibacillus]|uniref:Uncharacterized protein n=1 Tax=Paenibacillus alvei TaxID=44250 RepID=A0ABT4EEE0_PAEAL|nr:MULTISPECIES: hypothetical protein [Paenibacillus]MCY9530993.1 hypothetical protein [Paenibacillus alvei]
MRTDERIVFRHHPREDMPNAVGWIKAGVVSISGSPPLLGACMLGEACMMKVPYVNVVSHCWTEQGW